MHLYVEPSAGTQPVVQIIEQAKQEVDLNAYTLTDRVVLSAIRAAVRRGVTAHVILERHPYRESLKRVERERKKVEATGARVHWAPKRFRYSHAKYVCNLTACEIGTANFSWSAFHRNREYLAVVHRPQIVHAARTVFEADWADHPAGTEPRKALVLSPGSKTGLLRVIGQSGPVDIEEEELGSVSGVLRKLVNKSQAGVRVLLPSRARHSHSVLRRVALLREHGVRVRYLPHPYLHAKMIVGQAVAFIGSENFSWTSMQKNREMGLLLTQPRSLGVLRAQFESDWSSATP